MPTHAEIIAASASGRNLYYKANKKAPAAPSFDEVLNPGVGNWDTSLAAQWTTISRGRNRAERMPGEHYGDYVPEPSTVTKLQMASAENEMLKDQVAQLRRQLSDETNARALIIGGLQAENRELRSRGPSNLSRVMRALVIELPD